MTPDRNESFGLGKTYHRIADLQDEYGGNTYSGIAPSGDHPIVFLFTGSGGEEYGYDDEFLEDGTFLYTGEGRKGDMEMKRGNAAVRDHKEDGRELHVFEQQEEAWQVTYVGEYEYHDHHWQRLPDENGEMRDAIRFELVPAGGTEIDVGQRSLDDLDDQDLYEWAAKSATGGGSPGENSGSRTTYRRSEVVKEYALRVADGVCQGCGEDAPFLDKNGDPFLEVHHLHRRSDGGVDHPDNVIGLCPNCHRRVHYGQDGETFNQESVEKMEN